MDEMKHFQTDEFGAVKKRSLGDNRDEFVSVFECKKVAGKTEERIRGWMLVRMGKLLHD